MENKIQNGFLMLADISGYTPFMATTELEHAQEIIAEFLRTIIRKITPTFNLVEVEGDAIYVYASDKKLTRQEIILEIIESAYSEFYKKKLFMQERSFCICRACKSIKLLNLKFVNHYGNFILQDIGGKIKPIGSDINLAHRLLKNSLADKTGWKGYALFTEQWLNKVGLSLPNFYTHSETYEHFGELNLSAYNLEEQISILNDKEVYFPDEKEWVHYQSDFEATPAEVWDWINDPVKRSLWMKETQWSSGKRINGRTTSGSTNHCHHGSNTVLENIIEWKPFKYQHYEILAKPFTISTQLFYEQQNDITRLNQFVKVKSFLPDFINKILSKYVGDKEMKVKECHKEINELIKISRKENQIIEIPESLNIYTIQQS